MPPSPQELRISLAVLGENASPHRGSRDTLGRGGYVHRFGGYRERLSQGGNPFHAHFDDAADRFVPCRAWRPRPCGNQRERLCSRGRFRISCTPSLSPIDALPRL